MEQLETIQKLFELGYITVDEYEKRKTQIIDSLTNTRIFSSSRHSPEERHELASSIGKLEHKHIEYIVHILKAKSPNSFSQSPTGLYSFYIDEFDDGTFVEVSKFVNSCIEQSSAKSAFSIGPGSSLPYPGVKRRRELAECYEDDGDLIQTAVMESGVPEAGISEAGSPSSSTTVIKRQPSKEEPIWDAPKRRRENTEWKESESESLLSLPLLTADPEINLRGSMELDDADFALDHLMVLEPEIPPFLDENPNTFNTFSDIDPLTYEQIAALLQDPALGPVMDYPDPMLTLPVTPTIEPSFEPLDLQLLSSPPPTPAPDTKPESKKIKIKIQIYQVEKDGEDSKKPWRCDSPGCGKTFSDSSNLLKHIRTHTGEKPYSCTECSKGFSHSSSLKEHMNTHQDAKPFVCAHPGCGKSFAQGSNLRRHQRIHTGAKPYTCEVCGKDFNQSSNHKQHLSKVHGVTKTTRKTPVKKES